MANRMNVEFKSLNSEGLRFHVGEKNYYNYGDYRTLSLDIQVVSMLPSFGPNNDGKQAVAAVNATIAASNPWVKEGVLHVNDASGDDYFTVDVSQYIQDGEMAQLHFRAPSYFSLVIGTAETVDNSTAHFFDASDLRNPEETQCSHNKRETEWLVNTTRVVETQCEREDGHQGSHQSFSNDLDRSWDESGSGSKSWGVVFGVPLKCQHCGEVGAEFDVASPACFMCNFWLGHHAHGRGIIIDGRHYLPGKGGFGGHQFKVEFFNKERKIWTGELFTQGYVPERFLPLFPDTAKFVGRFGM